jgi:hypothetical protein
VRWTSPRARSACCLAGAAEDAKEQIGMMRRRRGNRKKVEGRCCEQGRGLTVAAGDGEEKMALPYHRWKGAAREELSGGGAEAICCMSPSGESRAGSSGV